MDVRIEADPRKYEEIVRPFLAEDPFSTNVLTIELGGVIAGTRPMAEGSMWISVHDPEGDLVGAAMRTPPFNLFLPKLPHAVVDALAQELADRGDELPGVTGERATAERYSRRWRELTTLGAEVVVEMRLYVLGELQDPAGVTGRPRLAEEADLALVAGWLEDFHEEAQPGSARTDLHAQAARRISNGEMWLWEDGHEVVSLASVSVPVLGIARVGPVYTPPRRRRHGYGASVTASASRAAQHLGATHVMLYTDLANPVSNSIYQAIGYEPHHDSVELEFMPVAERESVEA